jgi:beta-lactamase class C
VFDAALLARAEQEGALAFDDPAGKYVSELKGGDISRVTIGQLATQTSGLLFRQDYPPWPDEHYTLPEYFRALNEWKADGHHQPGKQHLYTHAGFVLLRLALERSLGQPIGALIEQRVAAPLGMVSTVAPKPDAPGGNPLGALDAGAKSRAVQGYDEHGEPIGEPGDIQGYYLWPGTGQVFSSARDMAVFLAANLDGVPDNRALNDALALTHKSVFKISPNNDQALAWEINRNHTPIIEKNGGMNHTSTYLGFMPGKKIGIVILSNRGNQDPHDTGRRILLAIAGEVVAAK